MSTSDDHVSHEDHSHHSPMWASAHATAHCLVGCMIGEVAGLVIGVSMGLGAVPTLVLAIVLAFISGLALALYAVMRKTGLDLAGAFRVAWLGEVISIGVMELAMNLVDYLLGGVQAGSILALQFWFGLAVGAVAGFLVAWPVVFWLLKHELKAAH